jgi:hypothetical protein
MKVVVNYASTSTGQKLVYFLLLLFFLYSIVALSVAVDLANAVGNQSVSKQNATRVSGALGLFLVTGGVGLSLAGVSLAFSPAQEVVLQSGRSSERTT